MHLPQINPHKAARLVKGYRWYIIFYQTNPLTGEKERFRETFDLNRIKNLHERGRVAKQIIKEINKELPNGYPYVEEYEQKQKSTNILIALNLAREIKCTTDRKRTIDMVESMCRIFIEFLEIKQWTELDISDFTKRRALDFLDYALLVRKIGPRTYNNYIERMRSMFSELVQREYIEENPFSKLKKRKEVGKTRRAFNDHEKRIVANYIYKNDPWLMLGILLQYHCFIRPIELRRLRFYMFDLETGTIHLSGKETKNKENAIITIPDTLIPYLKEFKFERWPAHWLIFGEGVRPHSDKACGHNTLNYRQSKIIRKFKKDGRLGDIKGLTFYSWKDTGALELFRRKVNLLEIMRQMRHKDLKTTQMYCRSLYTINYEIKNLDNQLVPNSFLKIA